MASFTESPKLTDRYAKAMQFAFDAHRFQVRKQGEIPYISHLMAVSSLVLEAGGTEDEAIAALLHDYVEDIDPANGLDFLSDTFGYDVSYQVGNLSAENNADYVIKICLADDGTKLVSCADKLHNLRGYSTSGKGLWKPAHAEFYAQLLPVYEACDRVPRYWIEELKFLLAGLAQPMVYVPTADYERLEYLASEASEWSREFADDGDRPCQCGSGQAVADCSTNSQYCG